MRRFLALFAVLLAAVPALAASSIKSLNVRPIEVARAATLFAEDVLTPAEAAKADKESPATYARFGMLGNDARLINVSASTLVFAELYEFTTLAGAHAFYAHLDKRAAAEKGAVAVTANQIGDERRAFTDHDMLGNQKVPASNVLFRRGMYVALIDVEGTSRKFPASQATRIAALLDARLQQSR